MNRFRFSIRTTLAVTTVLIIACTALAKPTTLFTSLWIVLGTSLLLAVIPAAIICKGEWRAFFIGVAVFGWGHVLLNQGALANATHLQSVTTRWMMALYESTHLPASASQDVGRVATEDPFGDFAEEDLFGDSTPGTPQPAPSPVQMADDFVASGRLLMAVVFGAVGGLIAVAMHRRANSPAKAA